MRQLKRRACALAFAVLLVAGLQGAPAATAETQTESIISEQRTSLSVRITPEAAKALLPAGWESAAAPSAPNLSLIFMDRKLALEPGGGLLMAGVNRLLVLSMSARNPATGEVRSMIVGGYSADPAGSPGAYGVYGTGSVDVVRTERVSGMQSDRVEENWTVKASDGGVLKVRLSFVRSAPKMGSFELKIHSAARPDFYRIYRGRQASDTLRSLAGGDDRISSVSLKASGGKLGDMLKGAGPVLAASNAPFYARDTFLP